MDSRITYSIIARLVLAVALLAAVLAFSVGGVVYAADDPPELYEEINTGGDGDSDLIAVANQTAQKFISDNEAHSVTNIRVPLMRVGDPEYVTLELTTATSGDVSTGVVVATVTITDTLIPADDYLWIDFDVSDSGASMDGSTSYVIVVSAPYGDASNYVLWQKDTGGDGDADTVGSHSTNAGVTWSLDDPTDYLFEVWGCPTMEIINVAIFEDYRDTDGDWLIAVTYVNTYAPYYPTEIPASCFNLQLLDGNETGNLTASTNIRMWGYRPGSIYLSPDRASLLEWGGSYTIRMRGILDPYPTVTYATQDDDWIGSELTLLDDWVIAQARDIAEYDDTLLTSFVSGRGEVLNDRGHVMFVLGIPYLSTERPDLFEVSVQSLVPDDAEFDVQTDDLETELGAEVAAVLDEARVYIGVEDSKTMGNVVFMVSAIALCAILATKGLFLLGFGISYVGLIATTVTGVTDWAVLGVVTFVALVGWVFVHFSGK